jgi:predicted double-glycine peptidase
MFQGRGILAGFFFLGIMGTVVAQSTRFVPPPSTKILLNVPLVSQSTDYSCGPAALLSVLGYYGIDKFTESELMKAAGADPKFGTNIENLADVARQNGIKAEVKTGLTLQDLNDSLLHDQPIIVDFQAWPDETLPPPFYPDVWDEGHFAVVIGLDERNVYFMDPVMLGRRGYIPVEDFLSRWHERSSNGEKWYHTALLFHGQPKAIPPWSPIP